MTATSTNLLRHVRRLAARRAFEQWTDRQLLERFAAGRDEAMFGLLVRRHGPMVLGLCRRLLGHEQDAEDAFQAAFLLLSRKAGSIRQTDVGGWLYRVAYHVAVRARAQSAKRQQREQRGEAVSPVDPLMEATWKELRQVVDEELQRLPEDSRSALVLCYLEGKTQDEAARLLGWSKGTLRRRLDHGRELLRTRLLRRGLAPMAALTASLFAESGAPAALPAALAAATVRTALGASASPAIVALAEVGLGILSAGKMKAVTAVLLLMTVFTGAGLWAIHATPGRIAAMSQGEVKKSAQNPDLRTPQKEKPNVEISGRVLDPDGKPVRGAKLVLLYYSSDDTPHKVWATSDRDGRFQLAAPRELVGNSQSNIHVIAAADGFGFAMTKLDKDRAADLTLRLVKDDAPIRGRILDLQGRPVAGARVRITDTLYVPEKGDLSAWLAVLQNPKKDGKFSWEAHLTYLYSTAFAQLFPPVTTGADGRFCIRGIGRERVAELRIEGPTIATQAIHAMTRPHEAIHFPDRRSRPKRSTIHYYGADFDLVAAPTRPVVGVVRDKDSGKPLAGVKMESELVVNAGKSDLLRTVTDSEGRYRLVGLPKGDGIKIVATTNDFPRPPKNDMTKQPAYISAIKKVGNPLGIEPVTIDFALTRGTWIKGRIADKSTGKSVVAHIEYFCFTENPNAKEVPFDLHFYLSRWTGEDGSFLIPALPGRGLIAVRANQDHYIMGAGAERIKERNPDEQPGLFSTVPYFCYAGNFHALVEINPKPGDAVIPCDIALDPGRSLKGTVLDPDGKPLAGARISGLKDMGYWLDAGAEFTVESLRPNKPRVLQFVHKTKKLAGVLVLRGDETKPISVRLEPWGALTGRLVSPRGEPLAGMDVRCRVEVIQNGKTVDTAALEARSDKEGHFRIEGLAPGRSYHNFTVTKTKGSYLREIVGGGPNNLTLKAGETKDLGDLQIKPME